MVGSRKLSNEEVEALLGGLEADKKKPSAATFDPNEVREFKFGSEDLSLLGDYYALRLINEKIARYVRSVFLPMLRVLPRISSFPPEVKSAVQTSTARIRNAVNKWVASRKWLTSVRSVKPETTIHQPIAPCMPPSTSNATSRPP